MTTYRVQSTSRKSGKQTTLDPKFLQRAAAETFIANLERKAGQWYTYAVIDPTAVQDAPSRPTVAPGRAAAELPPWEVTSEETLDWSPSRAQSYESDREWLSWAESRGCEDAYDGGQDWDTPRFQPTAEEQARHDREIREIERREWQRFEGLNPSARATPEYGEVFEDGGCRRCARTGQFITGMLNGLPTGPGGACFKCQGKGYQTLADCKRNGYWERHQRVSL